MGVHARRVPNASDFLFTNSTASEEWTAYAVHQMCLSLGKPLVRLMILG